VSKANRYKPRVNRLVKATKKPLSKAAPKRLVCIACNGLGLGVRAGFSAENSERATKPKFTKNCQTETFAPPDAKPLLAVAFIFILNCRQLFVE